MTTSVILNSNSKQALVQLLTEVRNTFDNSELPADELSFAWAFASMLEENYLLWTERDKLCYAHQYQKFNGYKHVASVEASPDQFYVFPPWNRDEEMEEPYHHPGSSIESFTTVGGHIGKSRTNAFNSNSEFRDESINANKRKYQQSPYMFEGELNSHKAPRLMNLPSPRSFMSLPEDRDTHSTSYFQPRFPNSYSYSAVHGSNSDNHVDNDYLSESESTSSSFSPPSAVFQFEENFSSRHSHNNYYYEIVQPHHHELNSFGTYMNTPRQYPQNSNNNNQNDGFVRIKPEPQQTQQQQQPLSPQLQQSQFCKDENNMDMSTSPTMQRKQNNIRQEGEQQRQQQQPQKGAQQPTSPVSSDDKSGDDKIKPEQSKKRKSSQENNNCGDNNSANSSDEEKPWQCPIPLCKSGYQRKGDLKYHIIRKHQSVSHFYPHLIQSRSSKANKNFVCPIATCQSGYMRYSDLKSHFVQKHPDKLEEHAELCPSDRLTCPVGSCGLMFTRHGNLIKHLKQEHPDDAPKIIKEIDNGGSIGKLSRSNSKDSDKSKETLVVAEDK